jgi:hypothetical protein
MINTRKNLIEGNMHICRGKVDFELGGFETPEEWVEKESETEVKSLLLDIIKQLRKFENK